MSGNFSPEEKILRSEASVNESIATFQAAAREFDDTPSPVETQNDGMSLGLMDYEINNLNEIFDNLDTLKSDLGNVKDLEKEKKSAAESSQASLNDARECMTNYRTQVKFLRSLLSHIASEADSASEDTLSLPEDFMADGDVTASPIGSSHGNHDEVIYKSEDKSVVFIAGNEGEILSTYSNSESNNNTNTNGTTLNEKQSTALSGLKSKWQSKESVSSEMVEKEGKLKTLRLQLQETTSQLTDVQEQSKTGSGKYTGDVQQSSKKAGQLRRTLLSVSTELDQNESAFMKLHKQLGQIDEEISQILDMCAYRGELNRDEVLSFADSSLASINGKAQAIADDVDVRSVLEKKQSLSITRQPNEAPHSFKERLEGQLNKVLALETNFLLQVETASENVKQFNAEYTDVYTRRMTLEKSIAVQEAKLDTSGVGVDDDDDDLDNLPKWTSTKDTKKVKDAKKKTVTTEEASPMSTTSSITTASTSPTKASPRLSQADMATLTKNIQFSIGTSVSDALIGQSTRNKDKKEEAIPVANKPRKNSLEDDLDDLSVDYVSKMSAEEEEAFEREKMRHVSSEGKKGGDSLGQENTSLIGVFENMQKTPVAKGAAAAIKKKEISATSDIDGKQRVKNSKPQIASNLSINTISNEEAAAQNESAYKYWAIKLPPSPSATKQQMACQDVAKAKAAQASRGTRGVAMSSDRVSSSSSPTGRGRNRGKTSMDANANTKNTFFASTLVGGESEHNNKKNSRMRSVSSPPSHMNSKDDVVTQAKKALLGNEGATLVQVVSRLEELANELEVQKALALNAVFDEEVEAQEQEKRAAVAAAAAVASGQDQSKTVDNGDDGLGDPSMASEEIKEEAVRVPGNALLATPTASGSSASAMKRAGQLSASRGLLDTLRKQQVELEQMRSLILSSADDGNRPQSEFTASTAKQQSRSRGNDGAKSGSKTGGSHLWKHFGEVIDQHTPAPVPYNKGPRSTGMRPRAHQEQNPQSAHRPSINSLYPIGHDEVKSSDDEKQLFVSPFHIQEGYSTQHKIAEEKINYTNSALGKKDTLAVDALKKTHFHSIEELKETISKIEESVTIMNDKLGALSNVEKIDPLTGFAIDENGESLGLLQVTVLQARELPMRLKQPVDSYVEAALVTPDTVVEKLGKDIKATSSDKDEEASKALLSKIIGTLQENSQRNLNIQRTSTQRKNTFPVWRDTMVFTPVITSHQELHFKLRNHAGSGSYEIHEALVDCVLPLQKLRDQMTHRFTLYCDRPKAMSRGYHGFKKQWMANVHAECSLRVEARLVYSKQALTRFRIREAQEKVAYLQHRLENFSTMSIEPPLKSRSGSRGSRGIKAAPSDDAVRQYRQYYRHFSKKYPHTTPGYSTPATVADTTSSLTIDTSDQGVGETKSSDNGNRSPQRARRSKPPLPRIVGLREKVTVPPYGIDSRHKYSGKVYSPTRKTTLAHKTGKQRFQEEYTGTFSQFEFHKRTSMYDTVQIDRMDMRSPVKPQQRPKSAGLTFGTEARGRGKSADGKKSRHRVGDSPLRDEINESKMRSRSSDAANSSFGSSIRREFVLSGPVRASRTMDRGNERAPFGSSSPTNRNPLGKKAQITVNVNMADGNAKVPSAAERLHGHTTMSSRKKRVDYMSVKAEAPLRTRKDAPAPSMNTPKAGRQPLTDSDLYDDGDDMMNGVTPTSKTVMNARKVGYSVKQLAGEMTAEEARTREFEDRQEFANTLLEKAARERAEQQAYDRKVKLEEDKEVHRLEEEAKAYAAQMRYRRTFRGAYMKVPAKSKKEQYTEAKKNGKNRFGKSDPTAHFGLSRRFK